MPSTMPSTPFRFDWRRCANHPHVPSISVCPKCRQAFCQACSRLESHGFVCPLCGNFCGSTEEQEQVETLAQIRNRSVWAEIKTILTYPFIDKASFIILPLSVLVLNYVIVFGNIIAICLMVAYGFQAMSKVSVGKFDTYQPHIDSIQDDLIDPGILAICAVFISQGPWIGLTLYQAISHNQIISLPFLFKNGSAGLWLLALICFAWRITLLPIALIVAGESKSCLDTLNPFQGFRLIGLMGGIYWETLVIVFVLDLARIIAITIFHSIAIPFLPSVVEAFVSSYVYLSIGCTLGFAIRKRAPEMGLA